MATQTYLMINNRVLEFDAPDASTQAFVARLHAMVLDPKTTEHAMSDLIYSDENPLLGPPPLPMPGRGWVTGDTLKNPVWHMMQDLISRKQIVLGKLDLSEVRKSYTVSVSDAAAKLGIAASAVRKAIMEWKLSAWRDGDQWWIDPRSVASYQVARRGPAPALDICLGSVPGSALKVKASNELEDKHRVHDNVLSGRLTQWRRIAVLTIKDTERDSEDTSKIQRLFVLEPGGQESEIRLGEFYVRGRFTITEKINSTLKAQDAWKAFEAS